MIRKERLPSGLTLLTESMPHVRSVTIGIWLRQGSRDEPARVNGISHFLEHLVFKGTETRSARDIALAMDSIGGQLDAFTSKEYTCFYAKVLDEHLQEAIELLPADIVQHPRFDPTGFERERQVILEEIRMVEDTPDELIHDLFSEACYPRQTIGRPIQGTVRSVSGLSRRALLSFFREAYRPQQMLIAAAGRVQHAKLARLVRRAFSGLRRGPTPNGRRPAPRARPALVQHARNELEQLHLLLGLPAYAERFERRFPLYVLNTILGGTISSRLFQRIREERGLAYSVYSALSTFADAGFLMVYAATSPDSGREVIELVRQELRSLRDQGPTEAEVQVAREHLKGSLMLSLESTTSRMSNLARQEIYFGRQETHEATLGAVDRVTPAQVHRLGREMFGRHQLSLVAVGRVRRLRARPESLQL